MGFTGTVSRQISCATQISGAARQGNGKHGEPCCPPTERKEAAVAKTHEDLRTTGAVYELTGTLLEACSCGVLCPCWIGEDPDEGECFSFNAYHLDAGQIGGVDVSGLNLVEVCHIPGNVLAPGSWRVVFVVDATATDEQRDVIVRAFRGDLGGPLADVAGLFGEVAGVETATIRHEIHGGHGTLVAEGMIEAEMEPYQGPDGTITTLRDSAFSTVPGSPAYVAKAQRHSVNLPRYGMQWSYSDRNAIQSDWHIRHEG
jgi:hypothetical protein